MIGREDDQSLIEACRAGRTEAFGMLALRYKDRLFSTLLRIADNQDDALDILQDAFLRAYQKLDHFQGGSSFYTWIYRIAVNLALSERRKHRPAARRALVDSETIAALEDQNAAGPGHPAEQAEQKQIVEAALAALAPEYRAVVVMKDMDGLRYEEIAEALSIPIGTVRSRLHRGRTELRGRLDALLHPDDETLARGRERIDPQRPDTIRLPGAMPQRSDLP